MCPLYIFKPWRCFWKCTVCKMLYSFFYSILSLIVLIIFIKRIVVILLIETKCCTVINHLLFDTASRRCSSIFRFKVARCFLFVSFVSEVSLLLLVPMHLLPLIILIHCFHQNSKITWHDYQLLFLLQSQKYYKNTVVMTSDWILTSMSVWQSALLGQPSFTIAWNATKKEET